MAETSLERCALPAPPVRSPAQSWAQAPAPWWPVNPASISSVQSLLTTTAGKRRWTDRREAGPAPTDAATGHQGLSSNTPWCPVGGDGQVSGPRRMGEPALSYLGRSLCLVKASGSRRPSAHPPIIFTPSRPASLPGPQTHWGPRRASESHQVASALAGDSDVSMHMSTS